MDVALQIIINEPTHPLQNPEQEAMRLKNGDIMQAFLATRIGDLSGSDYIPRQPVTSPRMGFVFITGVPNVVIKKLHRFLTSEHMDISDPLDVKTLVRRKWGIPFAGVPAPILNELQTNKYITVTWTQVKNYLRNKIEDRLINDTDLNL